jgi:hypothetical protein
MKMPCHSETKNEAAQREVAQIGRMIADLDRTLQILACEIATEEERAHVSALSDVGYPVLASVMAVRRANLKVTIAALQKRLLVMGARASGAITIAA